MTGAFDVYQNTGKLSFVAKHITVAGEGLLRQQVAELARKLEREGLMDPARKMASPHSARASALSHRFPAALSRTSSARCGEGTRSCR